MIKYNKLVRDRIPEIIKNDEKTPIFQILGKDEYRMCLNKKLDEEVAEFHNGFEVEELADILEVVFALSELQGVSKERLMEIYQKKHDERGGFEKRIFLNGVI